jgi:hypothetical protein
MDYNSLNNLLNSLEVKEVKEHKPILTQLERDINLKSNSVMNLELANPQRQSMNNNRESTKDTMNEKLKDYNFTQTKKYDENLDINFKK